MSHCVSTRKRMSPSYSVRGIEGDVENRTKSFYKRLLSVEALFFVYIVQNDWIIEIKNIEL